MQSSPTVIVSEDASHGIVGRKGLLEFPIGGPLPGAQGPDPYDLLSAALGACTATTVRIHATRRNYPLTRVEVGVIFQHRRNEDRDTFIRSIRLEGPLTAEQRHHIFRIADACPVGKTLGLAADVITVFADDEPATATALPKDYSRDVDELSIPNIDPD
jgi:putative redox protein